MFTLLKKALFRSAALEVRDLTTLTQHLAQTAIQLRTSAQPSHSYFGGEPHLPADFAWPERNGKKLAFMARISLADLAKAHRIPWLPSKGALVFFYDLQEQPWGFDPKDRDGWAVALVPELSSKAAKLNFTGAIGNKNKPVAPKTFLFGLISIRRASKLDVQDSVPSLNFVPLTMHKISLLPDVGSADAQALSLNNAEWEAYNDLRVSAFANQTAHQISGPPSPIQGEMELECQLASHGIHCGKTDASQNKRAKRLEKGAQNWKLLLQIEDDEELVVMFGDVGTLYFWVEEARAKLGDFSNVWVILQCS